MNIYNYHIALHPSPLNLPFRQGTIFETETGWGEATPLPGESLQNAIYFAARMAAEPFPRAFPQVTVCALASTIDEALQAIKNGFRTIKIKCKNQTCDHLLQMISLIPPEVRLRLDMNRSWSFSDTLQLIRHVNPDQIEYLEEPLADLSQIFSLPPFPIALDESMREEWIPRVAALIIKPTRLGAGMDRIIQLGQQHQKKIVFSSSFESAIGLLHIAHLQMRYAPTVAVGLDTYRYFKKNFLPWPIHNGVFETIALPPVDRSLLKFVGS